MSPELFSEGMFLDGAIYTAIALNLSEGIGSFWQLEYTETLFTTFREHPPLAIGLQSLFFKAFGNHFWVERIYSLTTIFITGGVIVLCWRTITGTFSKAWWPLLMWIFISQVWWAGANNMLENTMMIFTTLAVYFLIKELHTNKFYFLILAGFSIYLAFLSKGYFALYIWVFPGAWFVVSKSHSFQKALSNTFILVGATLFFALASFIVFPQSFEMFYTYTHHQVIGSVENVVTVGSRFFILKAFMESLIIPLILGGIVYVLGRKRDVVQNHKTLALTLILVAICGVFPIMISLKQRAFYILTVYPIAVLGLGLLTAPFLKPLKKSTVLLWFKSGSLVLLTLGVGLNIFFWGKLKRSTDLIHDVKAIREVVAPRTTMGICPDIFNDWGIHANFMRYAKLSLDGANAYEQKFLLLYPDCKFEGNISDYKKVNLDLNYYSLWQKKKIE